MTKLFRNLTNAPKALHEIPADTDPLRVEEFVTQIAQDGQEWEGSYFDRTRHIRPKLATNIEFDVSTWRMHCESLANGRNFDVWGSRIEDWMSERIDGDIPRSMRVRRDHITSNYHEIEIHPNIKGVLDVYQEERKRMSWKDWVEQYVLSLQTYGYSLTETYVDFNENSMGQVQHRVWDPGQYFRTPESKSLKFSAGCYWLLLLETMNDKQIEMEFPDIDMRKLGTTRRIVKKNYNREYKDNYPSVNIYEKRRVFVDDPTLEPINFGPEQNDELISEMMQMLDGTPIPAREDQDHVTHIQAKSEAMNNLFTVPPSSPEEEEITSKVAAAHMQNIEEHYKFLEKLKDSNLHDVSAQDLAKLGYKMKYPFGRYICWLGGKIVRDVPNPYEVPWRSLFRETHAARIAGRWDGAGDPEGMYQEAYQADMQLSRIEDLSVLQMPQIYRDIRDKTIKDEKADDNNPRRIRYTYGRVYFVAAQPPTAQLELYKISKENAQKDRGVNDVAYGQQPPAGTSARLVQLVQQQNQATLAGELDRNLTEAIEDIVECDLKLMKSMYREPREYIINGEKKMISMRDLLDEAGAIEISIKPGSNFPSAWERKVAIFSELTEKVNPATKQPLIPVEALLDQLAIQYPEFGEGGKYRIQNKALQLGMQVLQQQEAQAAAAAKEQSAIQQASQKYEQGVLMKQFNQSPKGPTNGETGRTEPGAGAAPAAAVSPG